MSKALAVLFVLVIGCSFSALAVPNVEPKFNPPGTIVNYGAIYYHAVTGQWPNNWQEVVSFGIVKQSLTFGPHEVNPDDSSLEFYGDIYYEYLPSQQHPTIHALYDMDGLKNLHRPVDSNLIYDEWFSQILPDNPYSLPELTLARKKQIAIAALAQQCAWYFADINKVAPASWTEFIQSDFSPIDEQVLNPLTGQPFRGDGSPNDLLFKSEGRQVSIQPVKPDGTVNWPINLP